jgi:hypothetical protein
MESNLNDIFQWNNSLHTQSSFIDISMKAGILRSGKGAIHASPGLGDARLWLSVLSGIYLVVQLSQFLVAALVSLSISCLLNEIV